MTTKPVIQFLVFGGGIYLFFNLYALLVSDSMIFVPQMPSYTRLMRFRCRPN